mgnify:CR=1 FL=1
MHPYLFGQAIYIPIYIRLHPQLQPPLVPTHPLVLLHRQADGAQMILLKLLTLAGLLTIPAPPVLRYTAPTIHIPVVTHVRQVRLRHRARGETRRQQALPQKSPGARAEARVPVTPAMSVSQWELVTSRS